MYGMSYASPSKYFCLRFQFFGCYINQSYAGIYVSQYINTVFVYFVVIAFALSY